MGINERVADLRGLYAQMNEDGQQKMEWLAEKLQRLQGSADEKITALLKTERPDFGGEKLA